MSGAPIPSPLEDAMNLSGAQVAAVSRIDELSRAAERLVLLDLEKLDFADRRWLSIGRTELQLGLMALRRAVTNPSTF